MLPPASAEATIGSAPESRKRTGKRTGGWLVEIEVEAIVEN
jgi:hypothetical protein